MGDEIYRSFFIYFWQLELPFGSLPTEIDAGSCHYPQARLLHSSEVVVAVAGDIICLHVDAVFLGIPHQLAIHLGVWMIAIHALLPTY